MRQKYTLLFTIVLLAGILRFWNLGANPASLDWDEAALGYNAYSILKTGRDEYGAFLPFSFRSFGDYKPPLYVYLSTIPVSVWGMTEFSVRFVSAFFGTLTILICFFLSRTVFESFRHRRTRVALLAAFFLAISPWHIQFSRIAFEANVGIFFFITGVLFFLLGRMRPYGYIFSFLCFALSMYTYHSPRLVAPLFIFGAGILYMSVLWKHIRWIIISGLIFGVLLLPLVHEFTTATAARFGSVTVLNPSERLGKSIERVEYDQAQDDWVGRLTHNRRLVYGRDILAGYLDHFDFDFLFLTGDPPGRHHAPGMGMLYFFDLLLVPVGILVLINQRTRTSWLLFWWFLVAPAASALTSGTPHAVRALLYLPTYQIFSAVGLSVLMRFRGVSGTSSIAKTFVFLFVVTLSVYYYLVMYWIHAPVEYASEWQYGYKQAVEAVRGLEHQVDRIVMTYRYDQPYVYVLFYNQVDPVWYQKQWQGGDIERFNRNFGKYEFRNLNWDADKQLTKTLLVGTPGEIPDSVEEKVTDIYYPDGSVVFRIVKR